MPISSAYDVTMRGALLPVMEYVEGRDLQNG